ncbi:MAG: Cro/CI family transcriptional regulator [Pseudomonadota bacterium]
MSTPVQRAIKIAGGQSALARALKISPQAVQQWAATNRVPASRVLEIERLTGVSRHALRPDIFGRHPERDAA